MPVPGPLPMHMHSSDDHPKESGVVIRHWPQRAVIIGTFPLRLCCIVVTRPGSWKWSCAWWYRRQSHVCGHRRVSMRLMMKQGYPLFILVLFETHSHIQLLRSSFQSPIWIIFRGVLICWCALFLRCCFSDPLLAAFQDFSRSCHAAYAMLLAELGFKKCRKEEEEKKKKSFSLRANSLLG